MTNKGAYMTVPSLASTKYIEAQMYRPAPMPLTEESYPFGFDIKISSSKGETNWLRITPEQFKKIEHVLLGAI
jgi:hypothetical protein